MMRAATPWWSMMTTRYQFKISSNASTENCSKQTKILHSVSMYQNRTSQPHFIVKLLRCLLDVSPENFSKH